MLMRRTPEQLFAQFDADGSGAISFAEFRDMLPELGVHIAPAKQLRYFRMCDVDGSGTIDLDEFRVVLRICNPGQGNTSGFTANARLTPLDAFEAMDEDRSGFLDEDEFFFATRYLQPPAGARTSSVPPLSEEQLERAFRKHDADRSGMLSYEEFRSAWIDLCDVREELLARGIEISRFSSRSTAEQLLLEVVEEEERREERAMAEARQWQSWQAMRREKAALVQRAQWRADAELCRALDAAGQVYVFGAGDQNQFGPAEENVDESLGADASVDAEAAAAAVQRSVLPRLRVGRHEFVGWQRVARLWQQRVRPSMFTRSWEIEHGLTAKVREETLQRLVDLGLIDSEHAATASSAVAAVGIAGASGRRVGGEFDAGSKPAEVGEGASALERRMAAMRRRWERQRLALDPYEAALASSFVGVRAALSSAALWGRRVKQSAVGESVACALSDLGDLLMWGGRDHWWHQAVGMNLSRPRGDVTYRSQLMLQVADAPAATDSSELRRATAPGSDVWTEERELNAMRLVSKYFGVWRPPPAFSAGGASAVVASSVAIDASAFATTSARLMFIRNELLPLIPYDDASYSLQLRGKRADELSKQDLLRELATCLQLERKLLGEKAHRSIREAENRIKVLRRRGRKPARRDGTGQIASGPEFDKRVVEMEEHVRRLWQPLHEVMAQQKADQIATSDRDRAEREAKAEDDYLDLRRRLAASRELAQLMPNGASSGAADEQWSVQASHSGSEAAVRKGGKLGVPALRIPVGGITPRAGPVPSPRAAAAVSTVALGANHGAVIHRNGDLYTWGIGSSGQLGLDGATGSGSDPLADSAEPVPVPALRGRPVMRIACGFNHTLAIVLGGLLFAWGSGATGRLGLGCITPDMEWFCAAPAHVPLPQGRRARCVSCGASHSAASTEDGRLFMWGSGDGGRLGLAASDSTELDPEAFVVRYSPTMVDALAREKVVSVACGVAHTLALTVMRKRSASEREASVASGRGVSVDSSTPADDSSSADQGGGQSEFAGGRVYAAGGRLVLGRDCPRFALVPMDEPVKQVAAGARHSALVTASGELYCWGSNRHGACGQPEGAATSFVPAPRRVACLFKRPENLARGRCAEQSSVFAGQEAALAVDGMLPLKLARRSPSATSGGAPPDPSSRCTCTHQDAQAWWEVDLGQFAMIEEIHVWNRADPPADPSMAKDQFSRRLFPCWLMVSQHRFDRRRLGAESLLFNLRRAVARVRLTENEPVVRWRLPQGVLGRFVRVQLEGYNFLHMAQVEVFGTMGGSGGAAASGGRVSNVSCGRDVTVAVLRPSSEPADLETCFVRAAFADAANADLLRQLESFMPAYDKHGRGDVLEMQMGHRKAQRCMICRGHLRCEVCALRERYEDELLRMPRGPGGRRCSLQEVADFLQQSGKPTLDTALVKPRKVTDSWRSRLLAPLQRSWQRLRGQQSAVHMLHAEERQRQAQREDPTLAAAQSAQRLKRAREEAVRARMDVLLKTTGVVNFAQLDGVDGERVDRAIGDLAKGAPAKDAPRRPRRPSAAAADDAGPSKQAGDSDEEAGAEGRRRRKQDSSDGEEDGEDELDTPESRALPIAARAAHREQRAKQLVRHLAEAEGGGARRVGEQADEDVEAL